MLKIAPSHHQFLEHVQLNRVPADSEIQHLYIGFLVVTSADLFRSSTFPTSEVPLPLRLLPEHWKGNSEGVKEAAPLPEGTDPMPL